MKNLFFLPQWFLFGVTQLIFLFYVCLKDIQGVPIHVENMDKLIHLITYFLLSFYFCSIIEVKRFFRVVIPLVLIGVLIEFLQGQTTYRSFEFLDMLANALGCFLGYFCSKFIYSDLLVFIEKRLMKFR